MSMRLGPTAASLLLIAFSCASALGQDRETAAVIDSLGLAEHPTPVREDAGWTKPDSVIVMIDGPDRLDWYRAALPEDVTLLPARNAAEAARVAAEHGETVHAAVGFCDSRVIRNAPRLHWIHLPFAGAGQCISIPEVGQGEFVLTNMQRVAAPWIAEHVMAMILYLARGLDHYAAAQAERVWDRRTVPIDQLWGMRGKTLLVAGLGGIGTQVAKLADGFGMTVLATRNSSREGPEFVSYVGLADELPDLLSRADVVVNALPSTGETEDLFDASLFARMKPGSLFINIGRGSTVKTADLIAALESGALAGAGLDVQDQEPMPADHPLWSAPNLLITPHVANFNDTDRRAFWMVMRENLRRYIVGEKLLSVVDIERGY